MVISCDYSFLAPVYKRITSVISMGGNARAQRQFLPWILPEHKVLNVGCGNVDVNIELVRKCNNVVAIDISPQMINCAQGKVEKLHLGHNVRFLCMDIMDFRESAEFDVIVANFFLNTFQWKDCKNVLHHLVRLLKKDGILCIADETMPQKIIPIVAITIFRPLVTYFHHIFVKHPLHPIYDLDPVLAEMGYHVIYKCRDKCDYILSTIYKKCESQ
ncbi:MAG: class I SAM-dependent methyltransferase [bacterium]